MGKWYQHWQIRWHLSWLVPRLGLGPKRRGPTWEGPNHGPWYEADLVLELLSCRAESPFLLLFLEVQASAPSSLPASHTFSFSGNPSTLASIIRIIASSLLFSSVHAAMQTEMKARSWAWMKSKIRRLQYGVRAFWIRGLECTPRENPLRSLRSRVLQFFFPWVQFRWLG